MNFETKCERLGITQEVNSLIANCECGKITSAKIVELSKMRKWEVMEVIGNYLDPKCEFVDWGDIKQLKTFCKKFEISEDEVSEYYAYGICEDGFEIAYAVNDDVVLVLE